MIESFVSVEVDAADMHAGAINVYGTADPSAAAWPGKSRIGWRSRWPGRKQASVAVEQATVRANVSVKSDHSLCEMYSFGPP
jgi:hypothetical protein